MNRALFDCQAECLSIAGTVPAVLEKARQHAGTPLDDFTRYTLFYDPNSGLVHFDLNWTHGDALSKREAQYCEWARLVVAGYYSSFDLASLTRWQLAEQIYEYLKAVPMP